MRDPSAVPDEILDSSASVMSEGAPGGSLDAFCSRESRLPPAIVARLLRPAARVLCAGLACLAAAADVPSAEGEAAEAQYRSAQRLATERTPEAVAALERVLALDPAGPLADDALVDLARLRRVPEWPEEIGSLDGSASAEILGLLDRARVIPPDRERAAEVRYLSALVRLGPIQHRDVARAREDLASVATGAPGTAWVAPARYALGWLAEADGRPDRAEEEYQRLLVDFPASEATVRARVSQARLSLRAGRFDLAAALLEEAIAASTPVSIHAVPLRELAVRRILRGAGFPPLPAQRVAMPARSPSAFAPLPGGGLLLLAEHRDRGIRELGGDGKPVATWPAEQPELLAVDPSGRAYVADAGSIYRLEESGGMTRLASLEDWASPSALAADGTGRIWLLDRRGSRLGRVDPGRTAPLPQWEDRSVRLRGLIWDGRRLVAIDQGAAALVTLDAEGVEWRPLGRLAFDRPLSVAADPSGRLAVLEGKSGFLRLLTPDGDEERRFAPEGVERAIGVAFGLDGAIHVVDSDASWVRYP